MDFGEEVLLGLCLLDGVQERVEELGFVGFHLNYYKVRLRKMHQRNFIIFPKRNVERGPEIIPFSRQKHHTAPALFDDLPNNPLQSIKGHSSAVGPAVPAAFQRAKPRLPHLPQKHLPPVRTHLLPRTRHQGAGRRDAGTQGVASPTVAVSEAGGD